MREYISDREKRYVEDLLKKRWKTIMQLMHK